MDVVSNRFHRNTGINMANMQSHTPSHNWFYSLALLLSGSLIRVDVVYAGRIAVGEIVLLVVCICAVFANFTVSIPRIVSHSFFLLSLLAVAVITVSDSVHQTDMLTFGKGIAPYLLMMAYFAGFTAIAQTSPRSIVLLFVGLAISGIQNAIFPTDLRAVDAISESYGEYAFRWTGLYMGLAMFASFSLYNVSRLFAGLPFMIAAVLGLGLLSRTSTVIAAVSGLVVSFGAYLVLEKRANIFKRFSVFFQAKAILVAIPLMFIGYYTYASLAREGVMGEYAQKKFAKQSSSSWGDGPWGLVLSARPTILASIFQIGENPILGVGSSGANGLYVHQAVNTLGLRRIKNLPPQATINLHTVVFGETATYGLGMAPFWIYIVVVTYLCLLRTIILEHRMICLIFPLLSVTLIGLLFNNLSSATRTLVPLLPILYPLLANRFLDGGAQRLPEPGTTWYPMDR